MFDRWILRGGIGALLVGVLLCLVLSPKFGIPAMFFGVGLIVRAVYRLRNQERNVQSSTAVASHQQDIIERLDRGQSLDEVARDYSRLQEIPPTRTLLVLSNMIRTFVGTGRDAERNAVATTILERQKPAAFEPPETLIEHLDFATNVFFVDETARFYPDESKPGEGKRGVVLLARPYLYFFADPEAPSAGGEFVKGLAKEKVFDWTGVPYLSFANAGLELIVQLREELRDYFKPEVIARLKTLFRQPDSFAIAHSSVVGVQKFQTKTRFGLPRERLVVVASDRDGHETRRCFGSSRVFDNRWTTGVADLIAAICVMEGRLLLY